MTILPFRRRRRRPGSKRVLVPFARGGLDPTVLAASIRIARAEDATLVPAYLIVTPLEFSLNVPMHQQVEQAMPLLEAVEHASLKAGVPVDARVESGRTPVHALQRLWEAECFDRIVVPAPHNREPGFTPKDLMWILTHAPSETVILRPQGERGDETLPGAADAALALRGHPPTCPGTCLTPPTARRIQHTIG